MSSSMCQLTSRTVKNRDYLSVELYGELLLTKLYCEVCDAIELPIKRWYYGAIQSLRCIG